MDYFRLFFIFGAAAEHDQSGRQRPVGKAGPVVRLGLDGAPLAFHPTLGRPLLLQEDNALLELKSDSLQRDLWRWQELTAEAAQGFHLFFVCMNQSCSETITNGLKTCFCRWLSFFSSLAKDFLLLKHHVFEQGWCARKDEVGGWYHVSYGIAWVTLWTDCG